MSRPSKPRIGSVERDLLKFLRKYPACYVRIGIYRAVLASHALGAIDSIPLTRVNRMLEKGLLLRKGDIARLPTDDPSNP